MTITSDPRDRERLTCVQGTMQPLFRCFLRRKRGMLNKTAAGIALRGSEPMFAATRRGQVIERDCLRIVPSATGAYWFHAGLPVAGWRVSVRDDEAQRSNR